MNFCAINTAWSVQQSRRDETELELDRKERGEITLFYGDGDKTYKG